jgi:hypothetical protein
VADRVFALGAALQEPTVQQPRRDAVVFVVAFDVAQDRIVAIDEPRFEHDDRIVAAPHVGRAHHAVERLEFLDRVARLRDAHRLAHHREEIDEYLSAEQIVDLRFARAVDAHQAA